MPKLDWEDQFMQSIPAFVAAGMAETRARNLLEEYIYLARTTALPPVLDFENHPELAATASPYLARDEKIHNLMLEIVTPLLSRYAVTGLENFERIIPHLTTCGVTLVANHLSFFDAAVIYGLLHRGRGLPSTRRKCYLLPVALFSRRVIAVLPGACSTRCWLHRRAAWRKRNRSGVSWRILRNL